MTNQDAKRELEGLRAEIAELQKARDEQVSALASTEEDPVSDVESDENIRSQFSELSGLLEQELKDLPAITTLMVFTLGILLGRVTR